MCCTYHSRVYCSACLEDTVSKSQKRLRVVCFSCKNIVVPINIRFCVACFLSSAGDQKQSKQERNHYFILHFLHENTHQFKSLTCLQIRMDFDIIVPRGVGPVKTGQTWGGALLFPSVVHTTGSYAVWEIKQNNVWAHHINMWLCNQAEEGGKRDYYYYNTCNLK